MSCLQVCQVNQDQADRRRRKTNLRSAWSLSLSFTAFSFQNISDSCTGVHERWPDASSDEYSSHVLFKTMISTTKQPRNGRDMTYDSDSKRDLSSSRMNCTSSGISSSDHFLDERLFANGSSSATSMAGRLAAGALMMRFLKVATKTRMTFSLTAPCATSTKRGMTSYFLKKRAK